MAARRHSCRRSIALERRAFSPTRPYQLDAAIQSAHSHRLFTGITPWQGIAALYKQLNSHFPTLGSLVAAAVAYAEAGDIAFGLAELNHPSRI